MATSVPSAPPPSLVHALGAIAAPLRFAARADFAHLERVKDLEQTLQRGVLRAQAMAAAQPLSAELAALARALPPKNAAPQVRCGALRLCLELLEVMIRKASALAAPMAITPAPAAEPKTLAARLPLHAALTQVRGIGPKVAVALSKRGLHTVEDLLRFLPRRYQGRASFDSLGSLRADVVASVEAEVQGVAYRSLRGRRSLEVVLQDGTGSVHLMWFRVPGRNFAEQFARGQRLRAAGLVKRYQSRLQMVHPEISRPAESASAGDPGPTADAITPLYLEVDGVHPKQLRRLIAQVLPAAASLPDPLPEALLRKRRWTSLAQAYESLHAPPPDTSPDALEGMRTPWQQRLIYDELLLLQLAVLRVKVAVQQTRGLAVHSPVGAVALAQTMLPFALTAAQARSLTHIEQDLRCSRPMQRLLQGDVGSGKTAVALCAAAMVARAQLQVAIMAPTELLAEQHVRTALKFLTPAGVSVGLLTGHTPAAERRRLLAELRSGALQVVVGTHALIQDDIAFAHLAFGIVDEQHRFGVAQRARLRALGEQSLGATPHMLVMTATPIPRTLALTVYGDLDVSVIDELPPGRTPVHTQLFRDTQREAAYEQVRVAVSQGRQAYVVFPLVQESEHESMADLRDATGGAQELAVGQLAGLRLGLLHGRLSSDEKDQIMRSFTAQELDVLVATTVIEVGIDVPNATVMVIEHAERFGLSQLHQLRGRVGRGSHSSSCLLLMRFRPSDDAWRRLAVMEETTDGFRIAEADLTIRGPGDFLGTRQAGLPMLTLANLARDQAILHMARADATDLLAKDPDLLQPQHRALAELLGDSRQRLVQ